MRAAEVAKAIQAGATALVVTLPGALATAAVASHGSPSAAGIVVAVATTVAAVAGGAYQVWAQPNASAPADQAKP